MVARANYLSQDRSDIQYAVKELSRGMSCPTAADWVALKRLGRYLCNRERLVVLFPYQQFVRKIRVWVDTDYAGCMRTRKSTSGGLVMFGSHKLKAWSVTQAVIALSSGEAEFYGIVKGSSVGLGMQSVLRDLGHDVKIVVCTDASAAKGIASRRGLGKVRHIEVNQLWVQERVASGDIELKKVDGSNNLADALTKHVPGDILSRHLEGTNQFIDSGRHAIMPQSIMSLIEHEAVEVHSRIAGSKVSTRLRKDVVCSMRRQHLGNNANVPMGAPADEGSTHFKGPRVATRLQYQRECDNLQLGNSAVSSGHIMLTIS